MVMFTKVSGEMTRLMAKESTCTQMGLGTKGLGKTTNSMGTVLSFGQMEVNTMAATKMA